MTKVSSGDEEEDRSGRRRSRGEDRENRRKKRKRKHQDSSSSDSSDSSSAVSASDENSDGEHQRSDRKKRKDRKRKTRERSSKEKSKDDRSKEKKKRRKRRHRDEDSDDSFDSDREKKHRLLKEAKRLLRKHKANGDLVLNEPKVPGKKVEDISEEDYFLKSNEFATWLKEDRRMYFSSLSSEETHKLFKDFVDVWNAGRLSQKYYDGIKQAQRNNHNWAIKKGPEDSLIVDEEEEYAISKKKEKMDRKNFKKEHERLLDEILPKATGRERLLEKKALRREQARAREDSPELMKEKDVMGGGDDFQQRLAREKARREKRQSEKNAVYTEKRAVFEEKEAAAMDQLRALVNVAGGKITIAKRGE